ncbi:MAG: MCE family protein [Rhodocyclaceae bacterium]|nr:MCE family protein [Rhodocyclaceae bacterium]MBX3670579.1 MCE family protein [Rhodocyclaceae bacterium]
MENRSHALLAGVFVIAMGVFSLAGVWWMTGKREPMRDYLLVARGNVSGLTLQGQVRYRGLRIGKVVDIGLNPQDVREIFVRVSLPEWAVVTQGTRAQINQLGVTGLAYVLLSDDGKDPRPLEGVGEEPPRLNLESSMFDTLAVRAGEVVEQLRQLLARANAVAAPENTDKLARMLGNLEAVTADLTRLSRDLPELSAAARRVLSDDNVERVNRVLSHVERSAGAVPPLADELKALVQSLHAVSGRLDALSSEAGGEIAGSTLPRVNALVADLNRNSRQLGRVLSELENSPQALIFGHGPRLPGPGETGYVEPKP